jgi:hypothetical protein
MDISQQQLLQPQQAPSLQLSRAEIMGEPFALASSDPSL